jgi:hypothetical protein
MSDDYNEQVEGFTAEKNFTPYTFLNSSNFRVVWSDFGDGEKNVKLSNALSDLITEVNVTGTTLNFNVLQTENREDLQLIELLVKPRTHRKAKLAVYTFNKVGDSLPYCLISEVSFLHTFSLSHSCEDEWDRPVTNFSLTAHTVVHNSEPLKTIKED